VLGRVEFAQRALARPATALPTRPVLMPPELTDPEEHPIERLLADTRWLRGRIGP
jgi:hypothetical protein